MQSVSKFIRIYQKQFQAVNQYKSYLQACNVIVFGNSTDGGVAIGVVTRQCDNSAILMKMHANCTAKLEA